MPSPVPEHLSDEALEAREKNRARRERRKARKAGDLRPMTEAQDLAHRLIEAAGFERTYVARNFESFYYRLPPHPWLLRLSLHKRLHWRKSRHPDAHLVVSGVAFGNDIGPDMPGHVRISEPALREQVAAAIGRYMIRAGEERRRDRPAGPA